LASRKVPKLPLLSPRTHAPSLMSKLEVREVFRLPQRKQFVIAGVVAEGVMREGMNALVWLDGGAYWSIPVLSVEFIDRLLVTESLIGLVCAEQDTSDAATCQELCPFGTVIEVRE